MPPSAPVGSLGGPPAITESLAARTFRLITQAFEGFRANPYQDTGGVWTIGYGSTRDALNKPISEVSRPVTVQQAIALADRDLQASVTSVGRLVTCPLNANQSCAVIDFTYNLGSEALAQSTLLKLLNTKDYAGAALEFLKWDHVKGVVSPGLLRRCEARMALFNTPI